MTQPSDEEIEHCKTVASHMALQRMMRIGSDYNEILHERAAARAEGIAQERLNKVGYAFQDRYDRLAAAAREGSRKLCWGHTADERLEAARAIEAALAETEGT